MRARDERARRDAMLERLFVELRGPAARMIRRAFGSVLSAEEIEDAYSEAWANVLATMKRREEQLAEDELRRYVMAAIANQAARELRRRGRRQTASLSAALSVRDTADEPDEAVERRERSTLARDVLASLPPRRRAVMMLRYAWGLEPDEVRALISGLSSRAYRKEVTRGVKEVAGKIRMADAGEWCVTRAPLLDAIAAGTASGDQRRQAAQHVAHCRHCADHLATLSARLNEVGAAVPWVGLADFAGDGRISAAARAGELLERTRDSLAGAIGRAPEGADQAATALASSGGARGAGAAGAGLATKLAGIGAMGKTIAACAGTGAAATACVAAGVLPVSGFGGGGDSPNSNPAREARKLDAEVHGGPSQTVIAPPADDAPATSPSGGGLPATSAASQGSGDSEQGPSPKPAEPVTPLHSPDPVSEELEPVGAPVSSPAPAPAQPAGYSGAAPASGGAPPSSGGGGGSSASGAGGGSDFGP